MGLWAAEDINFQGVKVVVVRIPGYNDVKI